MVNLGEEKKLKIITLLWGRGECGMHFTTNVNLLDDPVILPRPITLHNICFVIHIVQFNNFWFFRTTLRFFMDLDWSMGYCCEDGFLEDAVNFGLPATVPWTWRGKPTPWRRGMNAWGKSNDIWPPWCGTPGKNGTWSMLMPCARTSPPTVAALVEGTWIELVAPVLHGVPCESMQNYTSNQENFEIAEGFPKKLAKCFFCKKRTCRLLRGGRMPKQSLNHVQMVGGGRCKSSRAQQLRGKRTLLESWSKKVGMLRSWGCLRSLV